MTVEERLAARRQHGEEWAPVSRALSQSKSLILNEGGGLVPTRVIGPQKAPPGSPKTTRPF
jgi:hypothetical protein